MSRYRVGKRIVWGKRLGRILSRLKPGKRVVVTRLPDPHLPSKRDLVLAWCHWATANEPRIHYKQERPIPLDQGKHKKLPLTTDCSGAVTIAYYSAGAKDPNGRKYDGYGYTGTMLQNLTRIRRVKALPGDPVVFGDAPGTHVVILLQPGRLDDPLVFSHGQEAGPLVTRLSVQQAAHRGQRVTFLDGRLDHA